MNQFVMPLFGGVLIGLSATLLLLLIGRIAGISGIVWGAIFEKFNRDSSEKIWRWLFIVGLLLGAFLFHLISGKPYPQLGSNYMLAAIAGIFVGLGVKIGNGCTSGHGVCGIGRFSVRSIVATTCFMLVAILTVFLFNTVIAL